MSKPINFNYSNSLSATKQPVVPLKGGAQPNSFSVVATWSKPLVAGDTDYPAIPSRKAGPLKHWRKRLTPRAGSGMGRPGVSLDTVDAPGGSVLVGSSSCDCVDDQKNASIITSNKFLQSTNASIKPQNQSGSCCSPQKNNVIRSGMVSYTTNGVTDHSKKYYTTSLQYLKARGQTFSQKQTIHRIEGNTYINTNTCQPVPASDSSKGSQEFYVNAPIGTDIPGGCKNIRAIYKPNNPQYAKQGAVESGTRIMRLKNSILRPQKYSSSCQ
jgi:hypothetical protein